MIYSYEQCQKILDSLKKDRLIEQEPIGYTKLEKLPIRHFTLGNGDKSLLVTGAWHSNEIISTTFVLELINYIIKNNIYFDNITIHFIPILNPEGYIINTSAIKSKLSSNPTENEITNLAYEYYKLYKIDNLDKNNGLKLHQQMFDDTDYNVIPSNYKILKETTSEILNNHPKGSIIDWASNGNGIDLNSNTINKQVQPFEYNRQCAYNNIRIDIPSPIGHPGDNNNPNFEQENEIKGLKELLNKLDSSLIAYFNYHSIGGLIYQRPESDNNYFTAYNYLLSKYYQEYSNYKIIKNKEGKITSVNDSLRIKHIGNLLIELSPMMGNPIGMYGDINNYNNTINNNILSFIYTIANIDNIENIINTLNYNTDNLYEEIDKKYVKQRELTK